MTSDQLLAVEIQRQRQGQGQGQGVCVDLCTSIEHRVWCTNWGVQIRVWCTIRGVQIRAGAVYVYIRVEVRVA